MRVKSLETRVKSQKCKATLRARFGSCLLTLDSRPRSAMTLIELLVVIVIMTTLVAAAIPLLAPADDDRRLRESVRGLTTYISGAQSRAISLRRPVGIALKRLGQDTNRSADNGACLEVFYVEQLPPYAGFDANSRACVALVGNNVWVRFVTRGTASLPGNDGLPMGWDSDLFPSGTIQLGDVVEINGTQFELTGSANSDVDLQNGYFRHANSNRAAILVGQPINNSGQQIRPRYDNAGNEIGQPGAGASPYWTSPAPYKVLRQPTPTSDEPYQLPEGTAIDLRASGVGPGEFFHVPGLHDNGDGILVVFTPEGRVARVSFSRIPLSVTAFDQPVVDNVFLLVGRRDRIAPPAAANDATLNALQVSNATTDEQRAKLREPINWLSGESRWIVIGSQTGRVAAIDNATVDLASIAVSSPDEFTRTQQILAAREFTRDMQQMGGR